MTVDGGHEGTDRWLALPNASEYAAQKLAVEIISARKWLLELALAGGVRSRVALVYGFLFCHGTPLRDRSMDAKDWSSLADLNGTWWETGNGEWPDCEAKYLGIQIHAGDMGVHLGEREVSRRLDVGVTAKRGRPAKWQWEHALAHLVAIANGPDGLHPLDAPITDSFIAGLLAEWFQENQGDQPSDSELRKHAALVSNAIRNHPSRR